MAIPFGSSVKGLLLSPGALGFFKTSKAGPSRFFPTGGVEAFSYSSILFLLAADGVAGVGDIEPADAAGLSRLLSLPAPRPLSCNEAASAASSASWSAADPVPVSTRVAPCSGGKATPPVSWLWRPCWSEDAESTRLGSVDAGVEVAGNSDCIKRIGEMKGMRWTEPDLSGSVE